MPVNRSALNRYQVLDECLRRRQRHWTFQDLLDEVNRRVAEVEGKPISESTVRHDLGAMKAGKVLNRAAPIKCLDGHYFYEEADFALFQTTIDSDDAEVLRQVLDTMTPFRGLPLVGELTAVAEKLTQASTASQAGKRPTLIHFDSVEYAGARWLAPLYEAIRARYVIGFRYKPYAADERSETIHPYLLKQYNHRWFLLGRCAELNQLRIYPLDRIMSERIEPLPKREFWPNDLLDPATYFNQIIGVSPAEGGAVEEVRLRFSPTRAPYVSTKPLHPSQSEPLITEAGTEFSLRVGLNRELVSLLLSFGADVEVLAPAKLREEIADTMRAGAARYDAQNPARSSDSGGVIGS